MYVCVHARVRDGEEETEILQAVKFTFCFRFRHSLKHRNLWQPRIQKTRPESKQISSVCVCVCGIDPIKYQQTSNLTVQLD